MKKENKILRPIFLIFALLLTTALLSSCTDTLYVARINDDKVGKGEFMVYLREQKKKFEEQGGEDIWEADFDGVSAVEVAKNNALNTIMMVKGAVAEAPTLNVRIEANELNDLSREADEVIADFSEEELEEMKLTKDKVVGILKEVKLQKKVYDYITSSYVVNEEDFSSYYEKYKSEHPWEYYSYTVREIFLQSDAPGSTENRVLAQSAYDSITAGESFDEVAKRLSQTEQSKPKLLDASLYNEDELGKIFSLKEGESVLIDDAAGFYIINAVSVSTGDEEAILSKVREDYIDNKKKDIYQAQSEKWTADMKVEKNEKVWNEISVK